jgi:hypothetical protein
VTAAPRDTGSGRPLLDKLGVRAGMRVALVAFADAGFEAELAGRGATIVDAGSGALDLLFYGVDQPADLHRIAELRPLIRQTGAIWVLRVKGASLTVKDTDVIEAGRVFDLVDNKIASFSDTLAAMRLVVPLNQRRS